MDIRKILISVLIIATGHFNLFAQQDDTQDLLDKADFLLQNTRYDEALAMLGAAIERDPTNPDTYYKKANTYISLLRFGDAITTLEAAVEKNPEHSSSYALLGNLYFQFKKAKEAVKNYDMAFQTDDSIERKVEYKLLILDILDQMDRHRFSKKHLDDAIEIMGESFDIQFYEAMYYNETEQYEKAEKILSEIIKEVPPVPGNERYFYQLGLALHNLGKYKEAEEVLKNADSGKYRGKLRKFTAEYYFNLATSYFKIFQYDLAEKNLDVALEISPAYTEGFDLRKVLAAATSDKSKVIEAQEAAIKSEKDQSGLVSRQKELARLYYQSGQYFEALTMTDQYLEIETRDIEMIFFKAMIEDKLGEREQAHELLDKISKNPRTPPEVRATFNFALGVIYKNEGLFDKAEAALRDAYGGSFKDAVQHEFEKVTAARQKAELAANNDGLDGTTMNDEEEN